MAMNNQIEFKLMYLHAAPRLKRIPLSFPWSNSPPVGHDLPIIETSRSHSDASHSVRLLWTSDQPIAQISDNTQHSKDTNIYTPSGFEHTIPRRPTP